MKNYIDAMQNKRILVIGDIMLDHFVYGAINRISPESDAPVLDIRHIHTMPGGAGNVATNLKALGIQATILSVIGDDKAGEEIIKLSGEKDHLIVIAGRPTTVKTRFATAGRQLLRADKETRENINKTAEDKLLEKAENLIIQSDAVILSDYNKGVLTATVIPELISLACAAGIPVLVDPKKQDYALYKGATLITPNRKELSEMTGRPANTDNEISVAAKTLMEQEGFSQLIVTRSEDGISVFAQGQNPVHIRAEAGTVIDVSGAGDTAIAGLAAALAAGATLAEAATLANKAGGLVVSKRGTASIDSVELKGALENISVNIMPDRTREAMICNWDEAAAQIATWKKQGLEIGFTNGCFDILHYGHVNYLNRARDKCDILVLGLNHDQSIKILKGADRPLPDEQSRATVIGALGAIDMVVMFGAEKQGDDNTPCALIKKIRPDIYFKGGDYTLDQLPEAKVMQSIDGRVELMSLYEGHSTTATLEKMKKTEAA